MNTITSIFTNVTTGQFMLYGLVTVAVLFVLKLIVDDWQAAKNTWQPTGMLSAESHSPEYDGYEDDYDDYDDYYADDEYDRGRHNMSDDTVSYAVDDMTVDDFKFFNSLHASTDEDYDRDRDYYGSDTPTRVITPVISGEVVSFNTLQDDPEVYTTTDVTSVPQPSRANRWLSDAPVSPAAQVYFPHGSFMARTDMMSDGRVFVAVEVPRVPELLEPAATATQSTPVPTFEDDLQYLVSAGQKYAPGRHAVSQTRRHVYDIIGKPVQTASSPSQRVGRHSLLVATGSAAQRALTSQTGQFDIIDNRQLLSSGV